jgi:hypothetical protein
LEMRHDYMRARATSNRTKQSNVWYIWTAGESVKKWFF